MRPEKGGLVSKIGEPRFGHLHDGQRACSCIRGRALPWMQVARSSVLILPLHTWDIVAALSQLSRLSRYLGGNCLDVVDVVNADLSARDTVEGCIIRRADNELVVVILAVVAGMVETREAKVALPNSTRLSEPCPSFLEAP